MLREIRTEHPSFNHVRETVVKVDELGNTQVAHYMDGRQTWAIVIGPDGHVYHKNCLIVEIHESLVA